ncbi:hypothetical protein KFK09_019472 [Dendrobium nobile]|uniref:Polymerase/histidinol phosphatase N-terminal domain-containing protein n=1 Tax=Dendrobium nobile TaxID=94219 RepID=A0A8T3ARC9_DENNO|nr:hypothetical protein KFK09_019472 [Dendrobium nobile]
MAGGKNKGRGKTRKKPPPEQLLASNYIHEWVFREDWESTQRTMDANEFLPPPQLKRSMGDRVAFEFHCHSKCSDGYLSPSAVVGRAHRNGVKVLALTDHDTMAGIPEAMEAAHKLGVLIMPGVEISSLYTTGSGTEELVHILAYYGSCGPAKYEELNELLTAIRDGRLLRAKNMLLKLNNLKVSIKWEHIVKIAGDGVAPGRLHVARAMVQAGHVDNLKQAFSKYLYDGGPAYAKGSEPSAEAVVKLIGNTGGVAVLAHPWALKNPAAVIRSLKAAGLHAMEVYRCDGKVDGYGELADLHGLIKLGGSDFHGRGGNDESEIGSVNLPVISIYKFLKLARPIWCNATKSILQSFAEDPCCSKLEKITMFGKPYKLKLCKSINCVEEVIDLCLSSWLTKEERMEAEFEAIKLKLSQTVISKGEFQLPISIQ